jgi:hypothetical protein
MPPYIVPVDDDMNMFDHSSSYGCDNFVDEFILCLEEELQSGIIVRSSNRQAQPAQTQPDEKIVLVDDTPRTPTHTKTRIRRRPSHGSSCGSQSSSSCSSSSPAQTALQEQDELLEVSVYLGDDLEDHENDDASNSLNISLCEMCLDENDEEDLLLKALLNSDCVKREVEDNVLLNKLEAEKKHSMRSTLTGGILSLSSSIVGFMNVALQ